MPPYILSDEEISLLASGLLTVLNQSTL
jgi:hypothetical protein